jgi:SH3-like domain-containing protein
LTGSVFSIAYRKYFLALALCAALVFAGSGYVLKEKIGKLGKEAVVLESEINARFEPFEQATSHYVLYEGMKVGIVDFSGGWYKVKRPDGKIGWIPKESLGII